MAGVAIATVIADCVSASLVTYFLMTGDEMVRFNPKKMSLKKEQVIKIIKIGAPAGLQGVVFSVSNVCIQSAINGFGTKAIAGSSAALNYDILLIMLLMPLTRQQLLLQARIMGQKSLSDARRHLDYVLCGEWQLRE